MSNPSPSPLPSKTDMPSAAGMAKITAPISLGIVLLMMFGVVLRILLKRRARAALEPTVTLAREAEDLPPPALARFQRALAKGAVGVTKLQLETVAPVLDIKPTETETETCAICLDEMTGKCRTLPCGHTFHANCVDSWVMRANRCPTCNAPPVHIELGQKEVIPAPQGRMRRTRGADGRFSLTPVYDEPPSNPLPNTSTMGPHDVVLQVVPLNDTNDDSGTPAIPATTGTAATPK